MTTHRPSSQTAAVSGESGIGDTLQFRLPDDAPAFLCPSCQCRLRYIDSRTTVDDGDLSDRYVCPAGCGTYERVRRTHRLRGVEG